MVANDEVLSFLLGAVADKGRPAADSRRAAERKPAESMAHDVHNVQGIDMLAFNKAIFAALRPGGIYLVIDHAAAQDVPADVTSTLHRIRTDTVKHEVLAAGFVLEAQSNVLHNANDSHDMKVFDLSIQGKPDEFVLRFSRPLH